jgi:uncharacterized HAD superfamily protein
MKIAIDIDEVVVGFVNKYMEFIETKGFRRVDFEDVISFDLGNLFGIDRDLDRELLNEFNKSRYFGEVEFIDGARDGVCFLRDNHDICFITARPVDVSKKTRDFIMNEFNILGDKVIFSGDNFGGNKRKDEICKDLGIKLIIEDNGSHSIVYAENGLKVLLLDKPWNRKFEHENIFRCFSWDDVLVKVEELRNV